MVSLRNATESDFSAIFNWRNHESVREMMFDKSPLNMDKHISYWTKIINSDNFLSKIILSDNTPCGIIKAELKNNKKAEIDIFIDPSFQGLGVGATALRLFKTLIQGYDLIARIIPENKGSIRIFEKNGFKVKYLFLDYQEEKNGSA